MNKNWFGLKAYLSTPYFYERTHLWGVGFGIIGALFLLTGLLWGGFFAPADFIQGDTFRIIYVHVPAAVLSLTFYMALASCSLLYLIWQIKIYDGLAYGFAYTGTGLCALALISGAIWGKPMWGTWWVWDARLTSELILLFLYLGYLGIRYSLPTHTPKARLAAVLAVVGAINIPIIHYSVVWWQTLHQGASLSLLSKPTIAPSMLVPLYVSMFGFACFCFSIVLLRARTQIVWNALGTRWVKKENACQTQ